MCCVCQAASHEDASDWENNHDWYDNCENSANGATDSYGDGCEWYDDYRDGCGYYDTDDFISFEMCCACSVDYSDWENDWFDDFEDDDILEFLLPYDPQRSHLILLTANSELSTFQETLSDFLS